MDIIVAFLYRLEVEIVAVLKGQQSLATALDKLVAALSGTEIPNLLTSIKTTVDGLADLIVNGTYGTHNQAVLLQATTVNGTITLQTILDAIGGIDIPIPPTPPTSGENADAVWGYLGTGWHQFAGSYLRSAGAFAINSNLAAALPLAFQPDFAVYGQWDSDDPNLNVYQRPAPDWYDIRAGDTRLSWLQRTDTDNTWYDGTGYGDPYMRTHHGSDVWKIGPSFSEGQFQQWVGAVIARSHLAPIWPGSASATDGTPTVVTAPQLVVGPMHGCHITVDAVKPNTSHQTAGTHLNYFRAGWLAFINDVGEVETLQWLGFDAADYVCQSMAEASSVLVYPNAATQITVTPWLLS